MIIITIYIHTYIYLWQHVITTYVRQQQKTDVVLSLSSSQTLRNTHFGKERRRKNNIQIMYKNVTMTTSEIDMARFCNER